MDFKHFDYTILFAYFSSELRKALHLEEDMLPIWIYRMRILGYPPAWMQDAEMSTLNMIDCSAGPSAGNIQTEEGEIKETKLPSQQYNKDSLIEFPGFNAPIPENVKDVCFALFFIFVILCFIYS